MLLLSLLALLGAVALVRAQLPWMLDEGGLLSAQRWQELLPQQLQPVLKPLYLARGCSPEVAASLAAELARAIAMGDSRRGFVLGLLGMLVATFALFACAFESFARSVRGAGHPK